MHQNLFSPSEKQFVRRAETISCRYCCEHKNDNNSSAFCASIILCSRRIKFSRKAFRFSPVLLPPNDESDRHSHHFEFNTSLHASEFFMISNEGISSHKTKRGEEIFPHDMNRKCEYIDWCHVEVFQSFIAAQTSD